MNTTAFLSLEDIADNLPRYDESVLSVEMDEELAKAYEELEEDIRSAIRSHRGNKSLMSILLNTLLLYPDHPYEFEDIWARAFDPETKEYVKFLVTTPQNLKKDGLYAKERALIADVREELGRDGAASLCDLTLARRMLRCGWSLCSGRLDSGLPCCALRLPPTA